MANKKAANFFYAIFLALQLGFLIIIPLAGFLLLGIFLDKKLKSSPFLLVLSVIISFIFLFFEIRHFLLPFFKKYK